MILNQSDVIVHEPEKEKELARSEQELHIWQLQFIINICPLDMNISSNAEKMYRESQEKKEKSNARGLNHITQTRHDFARTLPKKKI